MAKPAVLFGGPSPEHDVSIVSGLQAVHALGDVIAVYWSKTGDFWDVDPTLEARDFADGVPRKSGQVRLVAGEGMVGKRRRLDLWAVVNCCHGGPGEDGTIQAAMDLAGLAYTGPSVAGAALGMDKLAFGHLVRGAGLPSLGRVLLSDREAPPFEGPYIVKPRFGGSSIGIEVVADAGTAQALLRSSPHLRAGAVVEPFRPAAEDLNVAVRSWPDLQLSAIEKPLRREGSGDILAYRDKYLGGEGMVSAPREFPDLPPDVVEAIGRMATEVARLTGLRGMARIDFLGAEGNLYVNEINTIPGSLARYLWIEPEISFSRLLADLLDEAVRRPAFHYSAGGADGSALRAAGTMAEKLG